MNLFRLKKNVIELNKLLGFVFAQQIFNSKLIICFLGINRWHEIHKRVQGFSTIFLCHKENSQCTSPSDLWKSTSNHKRYYKCLFRISSTTGWEPLSQYIVGMCTFIKKEIFKNYAKLLPWEHFYWNVRLRLRVDIYNVLHSIW